MKSSPTQSRRNFIKVSAATGGGLLIGFNLFSSCKSDDPIYQELMMSADASTINAFIEIGQNNIVTIMSPNPEIGQNIKTSMPMIVAEELDIPWKQVVVKQAGLNTTNFTRQVAGGSQSIRKSWEGLRKAGATARHLLVTAAANQWEINPDQCRTDQGSVLGPEGQKLSYGALALAASKIAPPTEVKLKEVKDFKIIGKGQSNVDLRNIIGGKPLFGIDQRFPNMQFVAMVRPPAFGQTLASYDDRLAKDIAGVHQILQIENKIAVVAKNTWAAFKAKKLIKAVWTDAAFLESSKDHTDQMTALLGGNKKEAKRDDGDVDAAFANADKVITRNYASPFLPHNCMEPMNFYADVKEGEAYLSGPVQTPEWTQSKLSKLLSIDADKIKIDLTRMGGGFGRRLYADFAEEAALVSQKINKPVQLVFTREDDMTAGTYRPASKYQFKAAIKDGKISAYHLVGTGVKLGNTVRQNWFPAGCIPNVRMESYNTESNISTGAWRAPVTNFLAFAEQAFFDELASELSQDPIAMRLELLEIAKSDPQGKDLDYEPQKMIDVLKLVTEKSNWSSKGDRKLGVSLYYCHNTYVAEVAEVEMQNSKPKIKKIHCAIDCGIVVNPLGALNQIEGGIIDGLGHALYGEMSFVKGRPQSQNFNNYQMIRMGEAPEIEVHFIESNNDPTGLGEPTLPPAGGAFANAIAAATNQRLYNQPFIKELKILG